MLGREFAYELIVPVAQRDEGELQVALAQLNDAGLLFCRGTAPHSSYLFKHALVQDTAYGTLLRGRRQELHGRVAAVLERDFGDLVERRPELLAHHLTAAGETERAIDQWLKAGRYATARLAHLEAIRHFNRGLATLATLGEGLVRDERELELQLARGLSLFTAEGFSAAEAQQAYARARELAERRSDGRQQFMAVYGLWQSANGAGDILDCRRLSSRLQHLTADNADEELRLQAHHSAWATCLFAGDPAAAREHSEAGRRLYDPERHRLHRHLYGGHDPGACACYLGAQAHWLLGYPDRSSAGGKEALALAERIAHPFSFALALQYVAMLHLERGEPELALQRIDAVEALAAEQRLGFVLEPKLLRGAALPQGRGLPFATRPTAPRRAPSRRPRVGARRGPCRGQRGVGRRGEDRPSPVGDGTHRLEGIALSGLNRLAEGQPPSRAMRIARAQQANLKLRAATGLRDVGRTGPPGGGALAPSRGHALVGARYCDLTFPSDIF